MDVLPESALDIRSKCVTMAAMNTRSMVFMVALALVLPAAVSFAADYDGFLPLLIDLPG